MKLNKTDVQHIVMNFIQSYPELKKCIHQKPTNNKPNTHLLKDFIYEVALIYESIYGTTDNALDDYITTLITQLSFPTEPIVTSHNLTNICHKIEKLKRIKQPEQRTEEWYAYRHERLTASDLATALDKNPYDRRSNLILKKCGVNTTFTPGPAIIHGVKYEPVAITFYEELNNVSIYEYGCLPHPTLSYFGASPDGICDPISNNKNYVGRMLEIKCPKSRAITGIVPEYYELQVQGQLEVCDLDYCDFLECSIKEYSSKEDYINDTKMIKKGMVLEKYDTELNKSIYIYKDGLYSDSTIDAWIHLEIDTIFLNDRYDYIGVYYWKLEDYKITLIQRDKQRFNNELLPKITSFWNDVLYYRTQGHQSLIKTPKKIKKKEVIIDFLPDSD